MSFVRKTAILLPLAAMAIAAQASAQSSFDRERGVSSTAATPQSSGSTNAANAAVQTNAASVPGATQRFKGIKASLGAGSATALPPTPATSATVAPAASASSFDNSGSGFQRERGVGTSATTAGKPTTANIGAAPNVETRAQ